MGASDKTYYANGNTVFFYTPETINGSADINVYSGYAKAPTLDANKAVATVYLKNDRVMAVVFSGKDLTTANVTDNLYVTSVGTSTSNYTNAKAFLAGASATVANAAEVELANGTLTVKDITGDLTLTKGSLNLNGAAKIAASSVTSDVTVNLGASAVLTVDASSNAVDISGMKLTAQLGAQVKAVDGSSNGITVAANLFYSAKDTAVSSNKLTDGKTYTYVNTITASGNSDGCGFLQEA